MEDETMIREILKNLKRQLDIIDSKLISGRYSTNESRYRYAEVQECIDNVLNIAEKRFNTENIQKIIKECL